MINPAFGNKETSRCRARVVPGGRWDLLEIGTGLVDLPLYCSAVTPVYGFGKPSRWRAEGKLLVRVDYIQYSPRGSSGNNV